MMFDQKGAFLDEIEFNDDDFNERDNAPIVDHASHGEDHNSLVDGISSLVPDYITKVNA